MRAIVLSGGGSKGSYQMGCYKAIKKLNIKFDIVTGTSVGALNGAFMVQGDYLKSMWMWNNINFDMVYGQKINSDIDSYEGVKEIINMYVKGIGSGGMDVSKLEETIAKYIQPKKFFASSINYGMVTVNLSDLKPITITKKEMSENDLKDYLMASATCYPFFKAKKINDDIYIDGGYYDNLPIELAIKLGADEIIAIDIGGKGIIPRKEKKFDIDITLIKPRNDVGSFLVFDKNLAKRNIELGYNDTMKVFKKLDGDKYTFKLNEREKIVSKTKRDVIKEINKVINSKDKNILNVNIYNWYFKLVDNDKIYSKEMMKAIELVLECLGLDETKIYNYHKYKKDIKNNYKKIPDLSISELKNKFSSKKISDTFDKRIFIKYGYRFIDDKIIYLIFPYKELILATLLLKSLLNH